MNEYVAYKESLQNKYPKYKTVSQANKLDFEHDKNILPDDTAFVEYVVLNPKSFLVFVFDKNSKIHAVRVTVTVYGSEKFFSFLHSAGITHTDKYLSELSL